MRCRSCDVAELPVGGFVVKKNVWVGFSLVALGCIELSAQAQFGTEPVELELIKLQDGLYVIHGAYVPGNVTALITNEGVILVDDDFEVDHDGLMAKLREVTSQPVKYVINTHYHNDHSGGNAKLQAGGTVAVASVAARKRMVDANQGGLVDVTIEPRGAVHLGGKIAEIYWLGRGHTDGDVVVLFPAHRTLAAGDLFTVGEGLPQLVDHAGGGSQKEWTATLDKMLELDFETVVPGHGTVSNKQAVREQRATSERLTEVLTQMVKQNRSVADIEAVLRNEFGFQDFHIQMSLQGLVNEMR
jgi:glyoxylase-like metal-dependent hydrolase (beta-lactamase superfamily II)